MTREQKEDIKALIAFYEARDWDWSNIVEYLVRKYGGCLPEQERWPSRAVGRKRT